MKSINKCGGGIFLCRVEFFKIGKRDVTFIREMRVPSLEKTIPPGIFIIICRSIVTTKKGPSDPTKLERSTI